MSWRFLITLLALALAAGASLAAPVRGIAITHHDAVTALRLSADGVDVAPAAASARPLNLSFVALGRSFTLDLEPNAGLLRAIRAGGIDAAVVPFRGRLEGAEDSWASIVLADGVPAGLVYDGTDLYAVEAPGDSFAGTAGPVMYRLADVLVSPGTFSCGNAPGVAPESAAQPVNGTAAFEATVGELGAVLASAPGAVSELNLGAVADFAFSQSRGSNAEAAIVTRLNNVDVIFSEQVGIQINVAFVEIFTTADEPFSSTTDPGSLLMQVGSYRSSSVEQRNLGLTHLYTGRDLDGSTVGIAYTAALCDSFYGAGLSEGRGNPTFDSLVAAHEIGHNFGAPHDGEAGSACEAETGDFIMSAMLNDSGRFSACSLEQMQDQITGARCINPLPSTDISLAGPAEPVRLLLTNAATLTFDVINNGTQAADNVVVDVTLPDNVALLAGSASVGTCTDGGGSVSCAIGSVGGGSSATVTVSAATTATGSGTFDAAVTAASDDNAFNNIASATVEVDPAIELVARPPLPTELTVDEARTLTLRLDNESPLPATAVTLDVSVGAGLAVTAANWPLGSCEVTAATVACVAPRFEPVSSVELDLGVRALTRGEHAVTVTLTAAEADADPANNTATSKLKVVRPASASDEGGGGSTAPFPLLVLLLLAMRCMRRRPY